MIEVVVNNVGADETMVIVRELRAQGLVQGKDFDFKFNPKKWSEDWTSTAPCTAFYFHTERYATLFAIKYVR